MEDLRPDAVAALSGFDIANRVFFRLYQASNLLHKVGTRSVAEIGCTTQQWAVLGALARPSNLVGGMTVKDLLQFLMVSRQNLTPLIDRLVEREWVERVADTEDRRSRRVRLTDKGRQAWDQLLVPIDAFYCDALRGFSNEEKMQFYRLLDKLKVQMSAM